MPAKNPLQSLHDEDREAYAEIDQIQNLLRHLAKNEESFHRHFKKIRESFYSFRAHLFQHLKKEEVFLFPFLEEHLPRLESVISLLLGEHEDFRQGLNQIQSWFDLLEKDPQNSPLLWEKIKTQGLYLTVLMKTHLWAESQCIYKPVEEELSSRDK